MAVRPRADPRPTASLLNDPGRDQVVKRLLAQKRQVHFSMWTRTDWRKKTAGGHRRRRFQVLRGDAAKNPAVSGRGDLDRSRVEPSRDTSCACCPHRTEGRALLRRPPAHAKPLTDPSGSARQERMLHLLAWCGLDGLCCRPLDREIPSPSWPHFRSRASARATHSSGKNYRYGRARVRHPARPCRRRHHHGAVRHPDRNSFNRAGEDQSSTTSSPRGASVGTNFSRSCASRRSATCGLSLRY